MCRGTRTCSGPLGSQGGGGGPGWRRRGAVTTRRQEPLPAPDPGARGRQGGDVARWPSGLRLSTHSHRAGRRRDGRAAGLAGARREGASGPERAGPARVCCRLPSPAAHPPCDSLEPWPRGRGASPFGPSPQSRGPRAPLGTQRTLGWPVDRAVPCLSTVTSCLQNSSVRTRECDEAVVLLPEVLFPPSSRSPRRAAALTCRAPTVALGAR